MRSLDLPLSSAVVREVSEFVDESAVDAPFELGGIEEMPSGALAPAQCQVIAIASGKGGTGKTTLTTNLAIALRQLGLRVLLIDADFGLANDHLLLGIEAPGNVGEVLCGQKSIEEIRVIGPGDIHLLPGGSGIASLSHLESYDLRLLAREWSRLESQYDICLVDLAAGISPQVLSLLRPAHEILLVTNPEVTALLDAYGLIKCLSALDQGAERRPLHLILNRVKDRDDAIAAMGRLRQSVQKHLAGVPLNFLGYIPFDRYLLHSISIQKPAVLSHPRSFVTACLKGIAQKLQHRFNSWERAQAKAAATPSYFALLERQSYEAQG